MIKKEEVVGHTIRKNYIVDGDFDLPNETHNTAAWCFQETNILDFIAQQNNGKKVYGASVRSLNVRWHLAGNLKTLKCMLGYKLGVNTMFSCI